MKSETKVALAHRRDFHELFARIAPLNRSGGHLACRRAGASSPAEMACQNSERSTQRDGCSGRQDAGPLRQAGCPPLQGSWAAATVLQPRIGTMNRKRRQAGRTPNASRVTGTLERRGSVWRAWSLLPLFGSDSWKENHQWPRLENSETVDPSPALEKFFPLPGGEGQSEGEGKFLLNRLH